MQIIQKYRDLRINLGKRLPSIYRENCWPYYYLTPSCTPLLCSASFPYEKKVGHIANKGI